MRKCLSVVLLVAAAACSSTPPSRVETDPPGATLLFVEQNLSMPTPAEFDSEDIDTDDPLRVTKDGYRTWEGTLQDLPRVGERTYRLRLEPRR